MWAYEAHRWLIYLVPKMSTLALHLGVFLGPAPLRFWLRMPGLHMLTEGRASCAQLQKTQHIGIKYPG